MRIVSAYTGRIWDKTKKRWKLENKRYFVAFYKEGEKARYQPYLNKLKTFLNNHYALKKDGILFGASDGAFSMKNIIKKMEAIPIASKFHVVQNHFNKHYVSENEEGINNWKHPLCLGYSAESDISMLKRKLGFGNRIYSLASFKKLLEWDNITVFL